MNYVSVRFSISGSNDNVVMAADLLPSLTSEIGFEGFDELNGYIRQQLFDRAKLDNLLRHFPLRGVFISYTVQLIKQKDWNETWEKERLIQNKSSLPLNIRIEPRMAFGSGAHPTTRMIVKWLMGDSVMNKRVLDCGCGTGILAITAMTLGAKEAVAYDIDPWCVENTLHNAVINNVKVKVMLGDVSVLNNIHGTFDIIMANICRNILMSDMTIFAERMRQDTTLVISGFYKQDIPTLEAKAADAGLILSSTDNDESWIMLTFKRQRHIS